MKKALLVAIFASTMTIGAYADCGSCESDLGDKHTCQADCTKPCCADKAAASEKQCAEGCTKACCAKKASCDAKKGCGAKACGVCVCKDDCEGKASCPAAKAASLSQDKEAMKKACAEKFAALELSDAQQKSIDGLMAACDAGGCSVEAHAAMKEGLKDVLTVNQFRALKSASACCCAKSCSGKKSCSWDKKGCSKKGAEEPSTSEL